MSTKSKQYCFLLADTNQNHANSFFWYETEENMFEDISKNYCAIYFNDEDIDRRNDFLKKFSFIEESSKRKTLSSEEILGLLKTLLSEFRIKMPFYNFSESYIGSGLPLWMSDELLPVKIRSVFRSSLYGFKLNKSNVLGKAQINFIETIRFEEFLDGPIYL